MRPRRSSAVRRWGRIRWARHAVQGDGVRFGRSAPDRRGLDFRGGVRLRVPGRDSSSGVVAARTASAARCRALCGVLRNAEVTSVASPEIGGRSCAARRVVCSKSSPRSNFTMSRTSSWSLRNSLRPRPIVRPSSGSRFGPTTTRAMTRMMRSSWRTDVQHERGLRRQRYSTVDVPRRRRPAGQDVRPDRDGAFSDPAREPALAT